MKPLGLAERTTTPAGRCAAISRELRRQIAQHAARTARWSKLPGVSQRQPGDAVGVDFQGPAARIGHQAACRTRSMDGEIANQRQMIGELHVRYLEAIHLDLRAVQNEIELLARAAARIGGQALQHWRWSSRPPA